MKIAIMVYHDVLEDRVEKLFEELKIDAYTKWERVVGKFEGADPILGSRTYPGHESVRLLPFRDDNILNDLVQALEEFNSKAVKPIDEIRMFILPLEKIV